MQGPDPDYARIQSSIDRRQAAAFASQQPPPDGEVDRWQGLDSVRRERAVERQVDLTTLVSKGYELHVMPLRGDNSHEAAWRAFSRWRSRMQLRYTEEVFRPDAWDPPEWHLRVPLFEEDERERRDILEQLHREAEGTGAGPRKVAVSPGLLLEWARNEEPFDNPFDVRYVEALDACKWKYVFHLTRPQHLNTIALFGLLEGENARWHSPDEIERASRSQTHPDKEFAASLAACTSFWPPFWVPDKLGGTAETVIVALDAQWVCRQRGTSFFPIPTKYESVPPELLWGNRNDSEAGFRAFLDCWEPDKPLARGFGPRPTGPEIFSGRIHPRHIKALIFRDEPARKRWFPGFEQTAAENYDRVTVRAEIGQIWHNRRRFGFP